MNKEVKEEEDKAGPLMMVVLDSLELVKNEDVGLRHRLDDLSDEYSAVVLVLVCRSIFLSELLLSFIGTMF